MTFASFFDIISPSMDKYTNSLTGVLWLVLCVGLALMLLSAGLIFGGLKLIKRSAALNKIAILNIKLAK